LRITDPAVIVSAKTKEKGSTLRVVNGGWLRSKKNSRKGAKAQSDQPVGERLLCAFA
jgi:hypothetical protein